MITKQTNEIISVFVSPEKLREIAGCLERQKDRAQDQEGLSVPSAMNVVEALDSIHTQIHTDSITVWFRMPKEEREEKREAAASTSEQVSWELRYCLKSQHEDE